VALPRPLSLRRQPAEHVEHRRRQIAVVVDDLPRSAFTAIGTKAAKVSLERQRW